MFKVALAAVIAHEIAVSTGPAMSSSGRDGNLRIFYVGLQRCGTKSFGEFFRRNGFMVASWLQTKENDWNEKALAQGQLPSLIESESFKAYTVFEDGPWFDLAVVRYLYWYSPNSRFVYFHRPAGDWFKSMLSLGGGAILGDPKRHCQTYNRLADYYAAPQSGNDRPKLRMEGHFEHYTAQFENHALQIRAFFEDKPRDRFFRGDLYDAAKWAKMNEQLNLGLTDLSDVHIHKSQPPKQAIRQS